ncbi:hypothetical protein [Qipengyuania mesophila]|uniref:hypothetical protein n=1 Tax=Qipengyuania mesophila TaxID=2867246 RepID=UPI003516E378
MKFAAIPAIFAAVFAVPGAAQDTAPMQPSAVVPVQAVRAAPQPETVLPAGTEIMLKMTQEVTTKGRGWEEGDQFNLVTAAPVLLGEYVVIPQGTKAVGRITWLTSRGAFGKSGKMDVEMEYLELGGRRINLDGTYRQEGNGATLATVGGVIAAGVFAGFITGRSGTIPAGRELMATLESDLPVALPAGASLAPKPVQATYATPARAMTASETAEAAHADTMDNIDAANAAMEANGSEDATAEKAIKVDGE